MVPAIQNGLRGLAPFYGCGGGISLLLVLIAWTPHPVGQLCAAALLDHVRRFVSGQVHIGFVLKSNTVTRRVG